MASDARSAALLAERLVPARRLASEVAIGELTIGGTHKVAVQSMTTTTTADAGATAKQIATLARAGCDIVRLTIPSGKDADALPEIRRAMKRDGLRVPLVADIHFTPRLALRVVDLVEKVRVNPGNFTDRKSVQGKPYDDAKWSEDVARLHEQFAPLVDRARELGVALRIGVNHGSLSDRLMQRFGDSPEGMVESALEFVRIAEDRGHRDLVISMKSSQPRVMVRAYRLLVDRLDREGHPYPVHLGVTEAGGGDEGRMKSAVGLAVLLSDGIGDTIRVSLTEPPENEIPVAQELVDAFSRSAREESGAAAWPFAEMRAALDPQRRVTATIQIQGATWGGENVPCVELVAGDGEDEQSGASATRLPVEMIDSDAGRAETAAALGDAIERMAARASRYEAGTDESSPAHGLTVTLSSWRSFIAAGLEDEAVARAFAASARLGLIDADHDLTPEDVARAASRGPILCLLPVAGDVQRLPELIVSFAQALTGAAPGVACGLDVAPGTDYITAYRLLAASLDRSGSRAPIVLTLPEESTGDPRVCSAGRIGALLVDGIGDAVRGAERQGTLELLHGIVQAAGRRQEQAEFIACPSCGRTLFELETTTATIRRLTAHLKLKIAVMGCVVNGPGEMADADFGFVGWGPAKVALFVGRDMVAKDIPFAEAPARLVALIKEHGRWVEPAQPAAT